MFKSRTRIRQIVFLQAVDLDAVLAEARVTGFACHLAQVGPPGKPHSQSCVPQADDEAATRFGLFMRVWVPERYKFFVAVAPERYTER